MLQAPGYIYIYSYMYTYSNISINIYIFIAIFTYICMGVMCIHNIIHMPRVDVGSTSAKPCPNRAGDCITAPPPHSRRVKSLFNKLGVILDGWIMVSNHGWGCGPWSEEAVSNTILTADHWASHYGTINPVAIAAIICYPHLWRPCNRCSRTIASWSLPTPASRIHHSQIEPEAMARRATRRCPARFHRPRRLPAKWRILHQWHLSWPGHRKPLMTVLLVGYVLLKTTPMVIATHS